LAEPARDTQAAASTEASSTPPPPQPPPRLGRLIAVGSFFAVLQRIVLRGLGLFSTLLLVRLLSPEDFGVAAVAGAMLTLLEMLTATSFGLALIRMPAPEPRHYDTAFTLTVLRGVLIGGGMIGLADLQAALIGDARVADVMWLIALTALLQSFESIRMIDLQREFRFDRLMAYNVFQKVLGIAITLPLAFWLRNYWALVLAAPIGRLATLPLSYWLAPYRPRLSLAAWREMFNFSKWLLLGNVCSFLDTQSMNWIIGWFEGVAAVGLYQVAYQVAALPISEIAAPIRQPIYAGFARVYHDLAALRRQFMTGLELQWVVVLPMSVGVALTAPELTLLFLGDRWVALVPLMPLVALFALFDGLGQYTHNVFIVLHRQALFVATCFFAVLVRIAATTYGAVHDGLAGAAWAMLATSVLNTVIWQTQASRLMQLSARALLGGLWRSALAVLVMAGAVLASPVGLPDMIGLTAWPVLSGLLLKAVLGASAFAASILLLWRVAGAPPDSAEAIALRALRGFLKRAGLGRRAKMISKPME
jgi:O-antigen/teichoic acid export membrane protein